LNWAYNQAVYMKYDSCVVSLEMTYDQCMDIICAMHSMHPKFVDIRIELGLQHGDSGPSTGLDYDKIRNGKLTPAEGTFLLDHVIPDFESGAKSGEYGKIHIETSSFTVADLKSKAESLYFRTPFSLLFVDHSGLLAPRRHHGNNATDRVNEVIRDLKGLAMDFNRGSGMAVVEMSQILRGQLVGGLQIPHTLSSIPDNGRSSDVVTASSSLLSGSRILFQCLKARNAASPFPDFQSRITSSRRILSCDS
jgi:replicative DNA helicase